MVVNLRRRGEELERDAVRVAEAHAGSVRRVLDPAVGDPELVEALRPLLELPPVRAAEGDVVAHGEHDGGIERGGGVAEQDVDDAVAIGGLGELAQCDVG